MKYLKKSLEFAKGGLKERGSCDTMDTRKLYHQLKEAGYGPWLEKHDMLPGQGWWTEEGNCFT